jgi:glycosyltransferase involved in cell wall biosynthesis
MRVAIAFVDKAIGISQAVCDDFQKTLKISEKKVIKILNGVDVEKFKKAENREENIEKRKELGIEDNTIVIGMFANFRKQKNHECLLRAIALLQEKIENREEKIDDRKQAMENGMVKSEDRERIKKDKKRFEKKCAPPSIFNFPYSFKIVLAGNGPEWKNIKQLSANLELDNCMMFLGPRLDIPELMNMIDIYCLPSRFEGLPFSLIEAMAAGKALVATDVIGNREVIENKKNGLLVKDNNSEDLANRLLELLKSEELREQLGKKAFEDSYKYSFDEMMRTYEAIFKKTTDEKKIEQPF